MDPHVRLETVPGRALAVVRRQASARELATVVPDACGLVWNHLRARQIPGAGRHVALYWDEQINLDVGVELDTPFASGGDVIASATPAGPVATAVHLGPYGELYRTHQAIRQWCANRGYELAGPNWEVYGHWQDEWNADPARIRTDVFYLVREPGA